VRFNPLLQRFVHTCLPTLPGGLEVLHDLGAIPKRKEDFPGLLAGSPLSWAPNDEEDDSARILLP